MSLVDPAESGTSQVGGGRSAVPAGRRAGRPLCRAGRPRQACAPPRTMARPWRCTSPRRMRRSPRPRCSPTPITATRSPTCASEVTVLPKADLLAALEADPQASPGPRQGTRRPRCGTCARNWSCGASARRPSASCSGFAIDASGAPPTVRVDRPWTEIAAEIGLTHEAIYRALAALERDGRIVVTGAVARPPDRAAAHRLNARDGPRGGLRRPSRERGRRSVINLSLI